MPSTHVAVRDFCCCHSAMADGVYAYSVILSRAAGCGGFYRDGREWLMFFFFALCAYAWIMGCGYENVSVRCAGRGGVRDGPV